MNTINKIIFSVLLSILFSQHSFAQWTQTAVPTNFLVSDMEIYKEELYAVVGYKVLKFQEDGISFEILTDNHEFQNALASNSNYLFASTNRLNFSTRHGVIRSTEGDTTWTRFEDQLPNATIFSLSAKDSLIAAGGAFGVYASQDNGVSWTQTIEYPGFGYFNTPIFLSDAVILVGGEDLVNVSFDNMLTWTTSPVEGQVRAFLEKENIHYLVTGTNVYKSLDKGISWVPLNNGLLENTPLTTIIDYTADSLMVAAGGALFTLKNGEETWHLSDRPDFEVSELIVFDHTLWAGGKEGIWKKTINDLISSNQNITHAPSAFQLSPNPFQHTLNVKHENGLNAKTTLLISDVNGQQVKVVRLNNTYH